MPHVLADITTVPLGTGNTSISAYVGACDRLLKQFPDLQYRLNPMSTTVEGELDRVLELIRRMHEAPFELGARRVSTTIRIDDRRDARGSMQGKMDSAREKSGLPSP